MEPVPAKSELVQLCGCVVFFVVVPAKSELPPKLLVVRLAGCAVVSVFGSGGKIGSFFVVVGKFYYDRKEKVLFCCGGKVSLRPEKKFHLVCCGGKVL